MTSSDDAFPEDAYPALYESWVVGRSGRVALHFLTNSGRGLDGYALTPPTILRGLGSGRRNGRFQIEANSITAQAGLLALLTSSSDDTLVELRQRFQFAFDVLEFAEDTSPTSLLFSLSGDGNENWRSDDPLLQEQRALAYGDLLTRLSVPVISSEGSAPDGKSWTDLVSQLLAKSGTASAVGSGLMIGHANGHPFLGLFAGGGVVIVRKGWDATSTFRRPIGEALVDAQAVAGEQIADRIAAAMGGRRSAPPGGPPRRLE